MINRQIQRGQIHGITMINAIMKWHKHKGHNVRKTHAAGFALCIGEYSVAPNCNVGNFTSYRGHANGIIAFALNQLRKEVKAPVINHSKTRENNTNSNTYIHATAVLQYDMITPRPKWLHRSVRIECNRYGGIRAWVPYRDTSHQSPPVMLLHVSERKCLHH